MPPCGVRDRLVRRRAAELVRQRVAVHAAGPVAAHAAAAGHPGHAVVVHLDVVHVVGLAVVAGQLDRLGVHLRVLRVADVGDPDRPPAPLRRLVGGLRRATRPQVAAAVDAAGGVPGGRLHVADDLRRFGLRDVDDVDAGLPGLRGTPERARIAGQEHQLADRVDLGVLGLPQPRQADLPDQLRRGRVLGQVVDLQAELAGDDHDVAAAVVEEVDRDGVGGIGHVADGLDVLDRPRITRRPRGRDRGFVVLAAGGGSTTRSRPAWH